MVSTENSENQTAEKVKTHRFPSYQLSPQWWKAIVKGTLRMPSLCTVSWTSYTSVCVCVYIYGLLRPSPYVHPILEQRTKKREGRYQLRKMKPPPLLVVLNITSLITFYLLIAYLHQAGGTRALRDRHYSPPSSILQEFIRTQAYSGPSRRGRGHWTTPTASLLVHPILWW